MILRCNRLRLRVLLGSVFPAAFLILFGGTACQPPPPSNILLITVDTLRADRLACYGGEPDVGLSICSIGDGGYRYRWAISPAPSTAPAIASILTSRYPSYHGVTQFGRSSLTSNAITLAEELAAAGYATGAVISNPVLGSRRQLDQGFQRYDARMDRIEPNRPKFRERDAASATDGAIEWLEGANEPWFLWVHYQDPHGPYEPPGAEPIFDKAGARKLPHLSDHSGKGGIPAYQVLPGMFSIDTYEQRYLDEIRYLDAEISRLLETATRSERSIGIALTADHAEAFGEDGYWFAHGHSVGFEQVRVPLLLRPPKSGVSREIATPVTTLDIAPTLLTFANAISPPAFQGRPLPSANDGQERDAEDRRVLYTEHRVRAGLLAGDVYYSRDRQPLARGERDSITGGLLEAMEPTRVQLDTTATGSANVREPTGPQANLTIELEALMLDFLSRAKSRSDSPQNEVSSELREQLDALGYLE